MKTEDKARNEFYQLLHDDPDFQTQWGSRVLTHEQALEEQENAFYEWCSSYDDLKHIKRKEQDASSE